jgi:excisionase family DNA binding protein
METCTIGQAASLLGVSPDTARRWADAGRFPTRRDGNRGIISGPDLAALASAAVRPGSSESSAGVQQSVVPQHA